MAGFPSTYEQIECVLGAATKHLEYKASKVSDIADQIVMFIVTWTVCSIYPPPYDTPVRGSTILPSTVAIEYRTVYMSSHSRTIQAQFAAAY